MSTGKSFADIVNSIIGIVDKIIPLFYALAFLFFVAGMARYFFLGQGEESREKGKQMMLWGIIAFVVMFAVWGIVNLLIGILTGLGGVTAS